MSTSSALRGIWPAVSRSMVPQTSRGFATAVKNAVKNPIPRDPTELDQITTLENGLRVATEDLPGPFSAVGVYINAGSRYENEYLTGASHIMDRLAFKSTTTRTSDQMLESLESLGGNIQCASSRESLMYQAGTFNSAVPVTLELMSNTIRNPLITDAEVEEQLKTAAYEIREIWSKPDLILPELLHMAAYKDNTLGNPLLCPAERLPFITKNVIDEYRKTFYRPENMVVAFAGVQHEEAVSLAEQYFGDMKGLPLQSELGTASDPLTPPPTPPQEPSKLISRIPFLRNLSTSASKGASVLAGLGIIKGKDVNMSTPSHYTGGFLSLPPLPPPVQPNLPPLSHIHLGFEGPSVDSDDIYAMATLQTLLGGGGSFSAGGPGKGMYSRIYTNVLNQHYWVESCLSFNHAYKDSGLFGISSSCNPVHLMPMLEAMCEELHSLTLDLGWKSLKAVEVNRAKNQLRSSLLMNLESRMIELEDLGRQVQMHGKKTSIKEMCDKIQAVTIKDLRRVASMVLSGDVRNVGGGSGAPTVVLQEGEQNGVQLKQATWVEIQDRISKWKLGRR